MPVAGFVLQHDSVNVSPGVCDISGLFDFLIYFLETIFVTSFIIGNCEEIIALKHLEEEKSVKYRR